MIRGKALRRPPHRLRPPQTLRQSKIAGVFGHHQPSNRARLLYPS